ncbi:CBS and ACT domain-containing protein [Desulfobacterales bacterium HSG17]|nr:CBS and ACT domain-containing protein [Desulfobacterales bacterium HSG17]
MYVGQVMHTELVTTVEHTSLIKAKEMIEAHDINHLLVVDQKGKLVGLVSDRDLKKHWASSATTLAKNELNYVLDKITVDMIMSRQVKSVTPATTIERAADFMQVHRISALPVLRDSQLAGIITRTDVMRVLLDSIGLADDSSRLTILVADRIGALAEITQLLKNNQINIHSLICWPEKDHTGIFHVIIRVAAEYSQTAVKVLQEGGFSVLTEFVEDLSPYLPKT